MCNAFYVVSKTNHILRSGYYESPLAYDADSVSQAGSTNNVDCFVNEVTKFDNITNFFFKNTEKILQ